MRSIMNFLQQSSGHLAQIIRNLDSEPARCSLVYASQILAHWSGYSGKSWMRFDLRSPSPSIDSALSSIDCDSKD